MWYYVQRTQFGAWPWPSDDPAHAAGTDEEKLACFRRVRDEIRDKLQSELTS